MVYTRIKILMVLMVIKANTNYRLLEKKVVMHVYHYIRVLLEVVSQLLSIVYFIAAE